MAARGLLVVISAPSGGGKTTIIHHLLRERHPRLAYSVSATTRPPRAHERDGVDYIFLSEAQFRQRIAAGEFVEWAVVHGYLYGTLNASIDKLLEAGKIVLLDIDVQGGLAVKQRYGDRALLIFLMPPSQLDLEKRLRGRQTESREAIEKRLSAVPAEIEQSKHYDHIIINATLEDTIHHIKKIIEDADKQPHGGTNG